MICSSCGATVTDGTAFCGSCGRPVVGYNLGQSPSAAAPIISQAAPIGGVSTAGANVYAGFWLRFVAAIIDSLVLGIPLGIIAVLLIASAIPVLRHTQDPMTVIVTILPRILFLLVIYLVASWLYWGLMESSSWQATLGKKALGLRVTDLTGSQLTFGRASGRFFAGRGISFVPSIGGLYFLIDCIMAGFTEKKQALHDMIASCLVIRSA
ncbi:MAG: RDD family protein [Candidatus Acidiferrales bacterium]